MQGGQACHIQPGPTKLGCDRGSTKGRLTFSSPAALQLEPLRHRSQEKQLLFKHLQFLGLFAMLFHRHPSHRGN